MLVYFIPITWLYILSNLKIKKYRNLIKKVTVILLGLFLCTTYFNGSDWRQYELMYKYASFDGISSFYAEKGFYLYMLLFKTLGFDFWWFFIITKLWCFYIFYLYMKENSKNLYFTLMLFYEYMSLYLFIDCPLRNLIAMTIFIFSIKYLSSKKYFKYYLLTFIAFSFHISAIFMILIPFIKMLVKLNKYILIFVVLIFNIIFLNQRFIINLVNIFPESISYGVLKYMNTKYFEQSIFSLGNIEKLSLILIILWNKKKIIKENMNGKFLISMLLIYYLFYKLAFTIDIFSRFSTTYFYIFYILNIAFLLNCFKNFFNKLIFKLLFFIYGVLLVFKLIYPYYVFMPYTSYFTYIFKEKPSYEYRSNYHFIKWEERFGKKYQRK